MNPQYSAALRAFLCFWAGFVVGKACEYFLSTDRLAIAVLLAIVGFLVAMIFWALLRWVAQITG